MNAGDRSFSDTELYGKNSITGRERLLGQLESLVSWQDLIALIEVQSSVSGRLRYGIEPGAGAACGDDPLRWIMIVSRVLRSACG